MSIFDKMVNFGNSQNVDFCQFFDNPGGPFFDNFGYPFLTIFGTPKMSIFDKKGGVRTPPTLGVDPPLFLTKKTPLPTPLPTPPSGGVGPPPFWPKTSKQGGDPVLAKNGVFGGFDPPFFTVLPMEGGGGRPGGVKNLTFLVIFGDPPYFAHFGNH